MRALRFLGMGMGSHLWEAPSAPRQLRAQDLPRYAFASGEGTT
mgnify:FL=1